MIPRTLSAFSIIATPDWTSSYLRLIKYRFNNLLLLSEHNVKSFNSQNVEIKQCTMYLKKLIVIVYKKHDICMLIKLRHFKSNYLLKYTLTDTRNNNYCISA